MYMCAYRSQNKMSSSALLCCSPPYSFETWSLTEPGDRLAKTGSTILSYTEDRLHIVATPSFFYGCWDLNSGPHTLTGSTFTH